MDSQTARAMALDMPGTAEKGPFGRQNFSVKKKTYMNLRTEEHRAVMKLTPAQQAAFCEAYPDAFVPGQRLGKHGWTMVDMAHINERLFRYAMDLAWRNVAPKWLIPTRPAPQHERLPGHVTRSQVVSCRIRKARKTHLRQAGEVMRSRERCVR